VVRPVPIATARPAHDAVRHAPAPRALSAQQICPDSNFLTRPMCLFRACQAHPYAAMPVCVELLQRLRENERRHGP
jgi:non-specific serine/threonine protein kinase